jgi:hypothetical protein
VSLWLAAARAPAHIESAPGSLAVALEAHRRLGAILDAVDPAHLERTREELAHLERGLRERAEILGRLLVLKRRLDGSGHG